MSDWHNRKETRLNDTKYAIRVIWPVPRWLVWCIRHFGKVYRQYGWAVWVPHSGEWRIEEVSDEPEDWSDWEADNDQTV